MKPTPLGQALAACLFFWLMAVLFILLCCRAGGAECRLAWDYPHWNQYVKTWRVYRGIELLAEAEVNRCTVDLPADQISTLSLVAVSGGGLVSDPAFITVIPFTPEFSTDLKTWTRMPTKAVFRQPGSRDFGRFSFPTD